ncbi:hypothetical protein SAMN05216464_101195 [Mucilaginibacter pineti]|uniref:Cytochrome oxidase complex assembly protein 1 n=1 Tax=Mucilaginibacter pineti TaxID=1391627 RepID=A0A1G6T6Q3_9SPHI|nr:hypothetical protein [Mucilaginibacter pineti]SDD24643.1 hypothetical protein SAMN05216464_101195 [Mucilaginibacter pineti]
MEKVVHKEKPQESYNKDKRYRRKTALTGIGLLFALGLIFVIVIIKFATSGGTSNMLSFTMFPSSDDAYKIAEQYISPTIHSGNLSFSEDRYQFAKKSDSVFVIKSDVTGIDEKGQKVKTNFSITLKYDGGSKTNMDNWTMLDMNEVAE